MFSKVSKYTYNWDRLRIFKHFFLKNFNGLPIFMFADTDEHKVGVPNINVGKNIPNTIFCLQNLGYVFLGMISFLWMDASVVQ